MKKLLILDSNSIINRAFYGVRALSAPDGTPTNAIYGFLNILLKLMGDYKPDYILAAFDLKAPTFRHKMYSEYKANRKGMPDELAAQMPIMKDILSFMNIPILELEGYEADDIIGTVSNICNNDGVNCYIATGDRDDLQLAKNGTTVILASTKQGQSVTELFDEDAVHAKYGVSPAEFVDMKALMGDTSDNIPGVSGIGEKTAGKLIAEFSTIENMYNNIDKAPVSEKIREKLIAERDMAFLSKELATIDKNVPISVDYNNAEISDNYAPELYNTLLQLGLNSIIKKLDLQPTTDANTAIDDGFFDNKKITEINDINAIEALGDTISVYLDFDGEDIVSAAFSNADTAYYMTGAGLCEIIAPVLADNSIKKYVFDIKDALVKLNPVTDIVSIDFDVALACYLIDPSKNNTLDADAAAYLGVYLDSAQNTQLSLLDDITPDDTAGRYALVIYHLAEALKNKIKENNQHDLYYKVELPLIRVLANMQLTGFLVDTDELHTFGEFLQDKMVLLEKNIYDLTGEEFNINSPKQLGEILFGKLGLKGGKKTKTGYSTKADVLEKLAPDNRIVADVLEYRTYQKLKSTYCDGLSALVNPVTKRIHSVFHQMGTITGRLSSSEPNMQNIPTRTELGRELRKMFTARDGYVLIDADYSQIELRVLAHLAQDPTMIEAFKNNEDIHAVTASKILNIPINELTKEQRSSAKAINFGIVYGMSEFTLSKDLNISFKAAKEYMDEYFNKYSGVRDYLEFLKKFAKENGYVTTILNRIRYIHELKSPQAMVRAFGERAAMNTPVQGSAADIMKYAMVRVYDRLKAEGMTAQLILQVHDELIIEAPENEASKVCEILKYEMENAFTLSVPLVADMHTGKSWYETK